MDKGKISLGARWANIVAKTRKFPAHQLKVIAVYGDDATNVAGLLLETLKVDGRKVALLADKVFEIADHCERDETAYKPSAGLFQRFFAACKKAGAEFAIVEVNDAAISRHALFNVPLFASLILTDGPAVEPLAQTSNFVVLPDAEEFAGLTTALAAGHALTFGRSRSASARIDQTKFYKKGTEAQMLLGGRRIELATFIANERAPEDMAAVAALAVALDIPHDLLESGIANYTPGA